MLALPVVSAVGGGTPGGYSETPGRGSHQQEPGSGKESGAVFRHRSKKCLTRCCNCCKRGIIMSGFDLMALKKEGAPAHPDYWGIGCNPAPESMSDDQYLKQLQAYKDEVDINAAKVVCSRPWLLEKLR